MYFSYPYYVTPERIVAKIPDMLLAIALLCLADT